MPAFLAPMIASLAVGAVQSMNGKQELKNAESLTPTVPPIFGNYIAELKRKQRNAEVGSMYSGIINNAKNTMAYGNQAVMQTGNPMAYHFAKRKAAEALNSMLGQIQQQRMGYENQIGQFTDTQGKIQYQNDVTKWANAVASAKDKQRTGQENVAGSLVGMAGMLEDYQKPPDGSGDYDNGEVPYASARNSKKQMRAYYKGQAKEKADSFSLGSYLNI